MTWDVVVQMLVQTEVVEIEVVVTQIVVTEAVVIEVALVVVHFEFALLSGIVPQWGSSGHSPLPAK